MKIEFTDQTKINKYHKEVTELLEMLGHPEALVSDDSVLSDLAVENYEALSDNLGFKVSKGSLVCEVAACMTRGNRVEYEEEKKMSFMEKLIDLWYYRRYHFPFSLIMSVKSWLRQTFIKKRHIIPTGLKAGHWYDTDMRMLHGMMNLLVQYIEGETI